MSREAKLADGTTLRFPDGTSDEVMQAAVKRHLGVAAPVTSRGGAPSTISPRNPGFFESLADQAGDIAGSVLDLPGALVDVAKTYGNPGAQLELIKGLGKGVVGGIEKRAGLLGEGRFGEFAGRTAADIGSAIIPGKVGAMVRPAESVAGGSAVLRTAEELGMRPRTKLFGLSDQLTTDPLRGATGNQGAILKNSVEAANAELGKMGVAPVTDAVSVDSLRRAIRGNIRDAEAAAGSEASSVREALRTEAGRLRSQGDEAAMRAAAADEAARAQAQRVKDARTINTRNVDPLMAAPVTPNLAPRVGAPVDPAVASEAVVSGVSSGRRAASNVLGGAVAEAKKPLLAEPVNAEELARIARGYGQEFPGVTDATGKLLFEEGAGPNLTYGAVDDIKRKLGYIGSDKNRAASSLARDLQESSLGELKGRGLDTSKLEAAQAAYKSGYADPYTRQTPSRVLKGAAAGKPVASLNIPLKEGEAWEQLVKTFDDPVRLGGDDVAAATASANANKEMLRRHVANNNMGLAQGFDVFQKNWQKASPRMKNAVFGAQETKDIDAILREYGASSQHFDRMTDWAKTRANIRGQALKGVEENVEKARIAAAREGREGQAGLTARARDLEREAASVKPTEVVQTPRLAQLEEVWNQYSPTRNLTDSPFLPYTPTGMARLLAVSMATKSAGALRHGLYQATRLGRPAMLYNLVAKQTRIDRKRPPEDVQSFEQFLEEKQQ